MTCREFEHFWSTCLPGELSPAARAHLSSCPACAAGVGADVAADAALRRLGAIPPPVDTDAARSAIRRAIAEQSCSSERRGWGRPFVFAVAGLTTAVVLAALLTWPAIHPHGNRHDLAKQAPRPDLPGNIQPLVGTPGQDQKLHQQPLQARPNGSDDRSTPPGQPSGATSPAKPTPMGPVRHHGSGGSPREPRPPQRPLSSGSSHSYAARSVLRWSRSQRIHRPTRE